MLAMKARSWQALYGNFMRQSQPNCCRRRIRVLQFITRKMAMIKYYGAFGLFVVNVRTEYV